ncbi:MAG: alkaline phosphatase family protein, partial [Miltoncostaeaceae bacterium]
AIIVALVIGVLNSLFPPVVAALPFPAMAAVGFIVTLLLDAAVLMIASDVLGSGFEVDGFGFALLAALLVTAVTIVVEVLLGRNDNDEMTMARIARVARRQGLIAETDVPGILFLEIDGLAYPVLQRAMRSGAAPELSSWLDAGSHRLVEWETDLSSQTGAAQAGILLGSNRDIPAFRWVDRDTGELKAVSGPDAVMEVESARSSGVGLLRDGGASRGNIFSGEAEDAILTVSRIGGDLRANPGYRAFFADGFNATRTLVLVGWELVLEWSAALRQWRRDVVPRGHRGGSYPFLRAGMCVVLRDLVTFSVAQDMMRGRPAVYATFASYDEVAHHSGLERSDTLEALRKVDQKIGRIARATRFAPRPYHVVVLSDHGQTQGATFLQRNGYGLDELVGRHTGRDGVDARLGGDEHDSALGQAFGEAVGRGGDDDSEESVENEVMVLGSGNLGLVYFTDSTTRVSLEEIEARHPDLIPALRGHPHIGWLLVRSSEHGALVLGPEGANYLDEGRIEGVDPLARFSPHAAMHLLRTDSFSNVADIMVNSFYDEARQEGCAFEELISFHGGMGGPQTRPFILAPVDLPLPEEPILGAEAVHGLLDGWRRGLQGAPGPGRPTD